MTTSKLKGHAIPVESAIFKKKHPIRWWFRKQLKWIVQLINANDETYYPK